MWFRNELSSLAEVSLYVPRNYVYITFLYYTAEYGKFVDDKGEGKIYPWTGHEQPEGE